MLEFGSATITVPAANSVLDKMGVIIATERKHPVAVEGHTGDRPIRTSQFPSHCATSSGREPSPSSWRSRSAARG